MIRLFLLRHGKATKYQADTADFERRLNKQGIAQVNQVGYILREKGIKIDQILASAAARTIETAEIMNHFLRAPKMDFDKELYLTDRKDILSAISKYGSGNTLLYVGHNNGISDLASYLSNNQVIMSTSQLIELVFDVDDWKMISGVTSTTGMIIKPDVFSF